VFNPRAPEHLVAVRRQLEGNGGKSDEKAYEELAEDIHTEACERGIDRESNDTELEEWEDNRMHDLVYGRTD